ncbi:putative ribonuclease H-like domain-containing protein [Tanacetum coccineum]
MMPSTSQEEIPPPPPPPPSSQTPSQPTPHTVSTIKLPILKKGEYDIWAMKMEHYLAHTDYPIWEVIQNGNGPVSITTDTSGQIKVLPPRTAEEIVARERERKARTTLLMALPEDHLAKFHKMTDAKEMWDAIKSRFGGNDESKKMQKYILKQQFEGFSVSNTEGLHKGYDRFQSLLSQLEIHGAGVSTEDANQKFLRSLPSAWSQVSLIMRTKPGVDTLSFDDLYNNLRVFESDIKGSTASSSSTPQNIAFVSENTSSTNEVSTAYSVPNLSGQNTKYEQTSSYSLLANQSSCPQLDHEDLEQIDEYDLEEMDLKWQVAMISMRMKKFYKKTGRKLQFDAKEAVGFDKTKVECYNCHKTGHFARECRFKGTQDNRRRDAWNSGNKDGSRTGQKEDSKALVTVDGEGVDWTNHSEDEDYALMACNSSDSDTEVISCSNKCKESYANLKKLYDAQREQLSDASIEIKAYSQGLKKVEAQLVAHQQGQLWYEQKIKFMKIDLDDKTDVLTYHKKLLAEAQKEKEDLKAKVEKWQNSSKNLGKLLNTQMSANDKFGLGYGDHRYDGILSYENEVLQSVFMNKESDLENQPLNDRFAEGMHAVPPPMTGNYMPTGPEIEIDYSQFTYGPKQTQPSESESQSSECDTCESNISTESSKLVNEPGVNESNVESQPKAWSDAPIIEEYESDSEDECVSIPTKQQATPSFAKLQVKTPRENVKNCDFHEKRMARKADLNNGRNNVNRVNKQNQFVPSAVLTRTGIIPVSTARASSTKNFSTARQSFNRQTVNMKENKAYLAEFQDFNGGPVAFGGSKGYITGKGKIKTGKLDFEDVCFVKELQHFNLFSVSQMCDKKNKVLFTDSECLVLSPEFKLPDENQVLLKIPRQNNMYSFNLENIVPSGGLACLIAKATTDESNKWHRRLGHVNFKNLNKLVKGNLVRGLPSKLFQNDHTCVACQKGKQHKASCKAKAVSTISHSLQLLHMDLFGPTSVRSLNHKTYCLVITDDFSRFSWVFFLRTKDETSAILKDFIRQIENQLNQKVKTIRSDNGTEFKNRDVIEFCGLKGIKREYSNARTPQQNGVAERKNRTLIEAARTMLYNFIFTYYFLAEAVKYCLLYESAQDCFVLPIWPSYSSTITPALTTDDKREGPREEEQVFMDDLERLKRQEKEANEEAEALRKNIPVSTASPYEGLSLSDPTNPEEDDSEIPPLEDIYQNSTDGIFTTSSYDDEGAVADFTNLESVVNFKQEAKKIQVLELHLFVSYVPKVKRVTNHKGLSSLFISLFLSQHEPKKFQKLIKRNWVDAMQEDNVAATLSTFLLNNGYRRGTIDKTLFLKKDKHDIILVQVYVDDMIFESTKKSWCDKFEALIKSRFQLSLIGELTFFLGLQVKQKSDGIFISQDKYVAENPKDSLDFANVTQKSSHLSAVKRIFRYLKGKPKLGLWYPRVSSFDLESYSDSDYVGAHLTRNPQHEVVQFLGQRLISKCKFKSRPLWLLQTTEVRIVLLYYKQALLASFVDSESSVSRQAKGNTSLEGSDHKAQEAIQRDPLFDEIPEDTVDHMETENAQNEGRTREMVDEDKDIDENILSTEDDT